MRKLLQTSAGFIQNKPWWCFMFGNNGKSYWQHLCICT